MAGGPNNWCPRSEDARTSTPRVGAKVLQNLSLHVSAIRTPGDIDTTELNEAFAAQAFARSPRRRHPGHAKDLLRRDLERGIVTHGRVGEPAMIL